MKTLVTFDTESVAQDGWIVLHPQHLNNLHDFVDDSECTEFVLDNILQYVGFSQIPLLLSAVIKKLRHGGSLTISFQETIEVFKTFINGQLQLSELNEMLFGNHKHASIISIPTVCEVLENHGLKIRLKQLNGSSAVVKAERE